LLTANLFEVRPLGREEERLFCATFRAQSPPLEETACKPPNKLQTNAKLPADFSKLRAIFAK